MDFNQFKTDANLENEGVWRKCGNGEILVASSSSERYRKVLKRLLGPHEMTITLGAMAESDAEAIALEAMAEGILLDWKGFTEGGKPAPYTKDNAMRLLKETPRFRQFVEREAASVENFRKAKEDAETKNS